jgi:hypothetical protein
VDILLSNNPRLALLLSNKGANPTSEDAPPEIKPASVQDVSASAGKQS